MAKNKQWLLSTTDNPHSPFSNYTEWYYEDVRLGHNTCGLLARMVNASDFFDDDSDLLAMQAVVDLNLSGKHIMVVPEDYETHDKVPSWYVFPDSLDD